MRVVRAVWAVVVNLVALGVVFAILQAGQGQFERLALAAIVLTYVVLEHSVSSLGLAQTEAALRSSRQFYALAKLLKDPDTELYADSLNGAEEQVARIRVRWFIDTVASAVGW